MKKHALLLLALTLILTLLLPCLPGRAAAGIPDTEAVVAVVALGYRDQDPAPRPRKALEEIVAYM